MKLDSLASSIAFGKNSQATQSTKTRGRFMVVRGNEPAQFTSLMAKAIANSKSEKISKGIEAHRGAYGWIVNLKKGAKLPVKYARALSEKYGESVRALGEKNVRAWSVESFEGFRSLVRTLKTHLILPKK